MNLNALYIYDLAMMQLLSFKRISCVSTTNKMTSVECMEHPSSTSGRQLDCPPDKKQRASGFRQH